MNAARRSSVRLALAAFLFGCAAEADPQSAAGDGTIVRIDRELVYFDLGASRGLRPGAKLQVLRTITAKHPISGTELRDHFPLGTLTVAEVGSVLSSGRVGRPIAALVKVGDVVRPGAPAAAARREPEAANEAGPAHPSAATGDDGLMSAWAATLGRTPKERVGLLRAWLDAHTYSPYFDAVLREIKAFRELDARLGDAERGAAARPDAGPAASSSPPATALTLEGRLPERLDRGDPLVIAIVARPPERVKAAFAYLRSPGEAVYSRVPLERDGDGYFRAPVPADRVVPPALEVYFEAFDTTGATVGAGTAEAPRRIPVDDLPGGPASPGSGHSLVRGTFEYVDFNRFRGNDWYLHFQSDFTYRIGPWLYSVSTGFGVLNGKGGKVSELDAHACDPKASPPDPACGHEVGFNYGYLEGEFHFGRLVGLSSRFLFGHTVNGPGLGAETRLRIGPETGTNLVVGGSIASGIGALALLKLEWNVVKGWPMSAEVSVTNQPAAEDLGVRIVYQISYRVKSWLQPTLRVGYDVRNIDHGGLSLGAGLVMGW